MSRDYYIIPIFVSHEGCPHDCVFCNQDRITGIDKNSNRIIIKDKNIRNKNNVTADSVKKTVYSYLETIDKENAIVEVSFFGGTFTGIEEEKQKELLYVAKGFKDEGKIDKIRLSTRPDYINEYILNYLKMYGVDIIELGVQSLDDDVLNKSARGHNSESVFKASKLIKDFGFTLGHQVMPGLPGDTFLKDIETAKKSILMKPDICRIYPSLVIRDTIMELMYERGEYVPYSLDEAVEISKKMYSMYVESGVNVIRIGLQPTDTINDDKDVIAGPFHPAFRELVQSSLIIEKILYYMKKSDKGIIRINPKDISKLYANKKMYFKKLKENNKSVIIKQETGIQKGTIELCLDYEKIKIMY